jgi:hypothetical protein
VEIGASIDLLAQARDSTLENRSSDDRAMIGAAVQLAVAQLER